MRSRVISLTLLTSLLTLSARRPLPSSSKTPSGFFWPAPDTIQTAQSADSLTSAHLQIDSLPKVKTAQDTTRLLLAVSDSLLKHTKPFKLKSEAPDPKRALWLALVLPGAGQIYNRKYWKLPIIYGGFIGCTYALMWNQQMYKDYSQAYIDIMDDDPNTASYRNILPYGYDITGREEQFKNIFRHKKDFYRKNRDLSIFAFFGVYIISVIDAYVDAQLSTFDISPDLSLHVAPKVISTNGSNAFQRNTTAVGVGCSLNFK